MSYEGYEEHVCQNGHQFDIPARYDFDDTPEKCPICSAPSIWYNAVDDTNCDSFGIILDWSSLQLTGEVTEKCNLGHVHVIQHATYRVPTEEELKKLRMYLKNDGEFHLIADEENDPGESAKNRSG